MLAEFGDFSEASRRRVQARSLVAPLCAIPNNPPESGFRQLSASRSRRSSTLKIWLAENITSFIRDSSSTFGCICRTRGGQNRWHCEQGQEATRHALRQISPLHHARGILHAMRPES